MDSHFVMHPGLRGFGGLHSVTLTIDREVRTLLPLTSPAVVNRSREKECPPRGKRNEG
jgi:hypothetical protein